MTDSGRGWGAIGAAGALHAIAWLVLPRVAPPEMPRETENAIEIEIGTIGEAPTELAPTPATPERVGAADASSLAEAVRTPVPPIARSETTDDAEGSALVDEGGLPIDARAIPRLDAATVARDATRDDREGAARFPTIDERLDRYLGAHARARPHVSRRPDPVLRPTSDGGYVWNGPLLTAYVAPNGLVEFSRDDVRRDGATLGGYRVTPDGDLVLGPSEDERIERERRERVLGTAPSHGGLPGDSSEASAGVGGRIRFRGLTDRLDEAFGNDHLAAEKRWFLARTEAFRDRLAARSRGLAPARDAGL